jgi:ABC-type sulfate transport system permease subunit
MSAHPYLRAYMAGIVVPTVFVLAIFSAFCVARFGYHVDVLIERIVVFPLALVPNLWGVWNMLYVALHSRRRLPLGVHGAALPLLLAPLALAAAHALGFTIPDVLPAALAITLPGLLVIYYLVWKYIVGFLNELLGIA